VSYGAPDNLIAEQIYAQPEGRVAPLCANHNFTSRDSACKASARKPCGAWLLDDRRLHRKLFFETEVATTVRRLHSLLLLREGGAIEIESIFRIVKLIQSLVIMPYPIVSTLLDVIEEFLHPAMYPA
jgi:hypothetical protein